VVAYNIYHVQYVSIVSAGISAGRSPAGQAVFTLIYSITGIAVPRAPASIKKVQETGVPIIYVAIDLDDGVRVLSEIVGSKPEEVALGDRVKVCFEEAPGTDFKLPKFQLVK